MYFIELTFMDGTKGVFQVNLIRCIANNSDLGCVIDMGTHGEYYNVKESYDEVIKKIQQLGICVMNQ